ncbi:hypothetical protein D3OALGA1CA_1828 [Olavius algarvensis associated proteobacterium Delta 3]|nr:hypothetical protein D3OALGA1CA_1828 [Olavius algarvensis associated proteobacterium Delta 3]CAB5135958.1 hypothetical protein D3OALGB2SA_3934 [Olavius algarvensis associated proteobacterium Delta 3]
MHIKLMLIPLVVATAMLVNVTAPSLAEAKSEINKNWRGLAIKGYDPVAFHTDGKPVKGSKTYEVEWKDAKWRFDSAEHRDMFKANPEKYAPVYGGYCAWAISQGTTADVNPAKAWSLVDGKLLTTTSR